MNGINFVADTNALIYLLNGNTCMTPYLDKNLSYSVISEMELLSYPGITESEENSIKSLLKECEEVVLSAEIKEKTIEVTKEILNKLEETDNK